MEGKTVYACVDREHDAWVCMGCGYREDFEADGPEENGWNFCPGCGHEITVALDAPCPFGNARCMCQYCEVPCNNGLNCSDCRQKGQAVHDVFLCTGFTGDTAKYIRSRMRSESDHADT